MSLDTFISLAIIGVLIWFKFGDVVRSILPHRAETVNTSTKPLRYKGRSGRSKPVNALNAGSGLPDARSGFAERSSVQAERSESSPLLARAVQLPANEEESARAVQLPANEEELTHLVKAITLKAQGATKQAAIEGGFGVSKGGTDGYKRAVALFDLATKISSCPSSE